MISNECTKCIHHPVCKTAESCDGFVSGCKHFKEEKHGRWITSATTWGEKAICSVCGRDLYVNEPGNGLLNIEDLHYCPNCGAKMDGGNEDG